MKLTAIILFVVSTLWSMSSYSNVIVTPFIGYTFGGEAEDGEGKRYDISPSANAALAVEFHSETVEWESITHVKILL
ncbi:hypothetical protein JCM19235_1824 [Vibrio maritimus]|uniref:Uncharacterized protein n=1 Tax=Vibrio maritimus TaxID=990268 RepID=A0A090S5F6_9VIBR|nr:hypothetical protein JCM19235_1824 [Vibrio maritimus]